MSNDMESALRLVSKADSRLDHLRNTLAYGKHALDNFLPAEHSSFVEAYVHGCFNISFCGTRDSGAEAFIVSLENPEYIDVVQIDNLGGFSCHENGLMLVLIVQFGKPPKAFITRVSVRRKPLNKLHKSWRRSFDLGGCIVPKGCRIFIDGEIGYFGDCSAAINHSRGSDLIEAGSQIVDYLADMYRVYGVDFRNFNNANSLLNSFPGHGLIALTDEFAFHVTDIRFDADIQFGDLIFCPELCISCTMAR